MKPFLLWLVLAAAGFGGLAAGYDYHLRDNPRRIAVVVDTSYDMLAVWPRVEPKLAEIGVFAAAVALRWSLLPSALRLVIDGEARAQAAAQYGLAADAFVVDRLRLTAYLLDRADEARRLAGD